MRLRPAVLAALASTSLAAPSAAGAATVTAGEHGFETGSKPSWGTLVSLRAGDGVANRLSIRTGRRLVVLRDAAERIEAGEGCRARRDGAVVCRWSGGYPDQVSASTGDGDDRVEVVGAGAGVIADLDLGEGADTAAVLTTRGVGLTAAGGAGDDVLNGGDGRDSLTGGDGTDRLESGAGDDWLAGEGGADELRGEDGDDTLVGDVAALSWPRPVDPPGPDHLDGGAGVDLVDYGEARVPVAVDLAAGTGDVDGVRDALVAIESARGGYGPDTLLGDDEANLLDGGRFYDYARDDALPPPAFGDRIDGRGGDDRLSGGTSERVAGLLIGGPGDDRFEALGATTVEGGPGNDLFASSTWGDWHGPGTCGSGVDSILEADDDRVVGSDCERFDLWGVAVAWPVRDGDRLRLTLSQQASYYRKTTCGAFVQVRDAAAATVLASATVRLPRLAVRELTLDTAPAGGLGARDRVRVAVRPGWCGPRDELRSERDDGWAGTLLALPPAP